MKLAITTLLAACSIIGTFAQVSVNINDSGAVSNAQKQIAARLMRYYSPNTLGTIPEKESNGPDGFQWFEMGFFWMAVAQHMDVGNDILYMRTYSGALANASFGPTASFLGGSQLAGFSAGVGKWNDDILWWGLAAVHGAEVMGQGYETPLGSTLFDIAKNTYTEVRDQWDNLCGGGLYWARNRNDAQPNKAVYKSTITNVQQILLGVRLFKMTGDQSYLQHAIQVYDWLVGPSGLVTDNGVVMDGVRADACQEFTRNEHSYNAGLFLGGTALLFEATKDAKYMQDISRVLSNYEKVFVQNNIFIDPCEVPGQPPCRQNQAQFKGVAIFSLIYVYQYSSDPEIKKKIKTWIETSATAMFNICNPSYECSNFWLPATADRPVDVHNQMNALFMSNTLSSIKSATIQGGTQRPKPVGKKNDTKKSGGLVVTVTILFSIFSAIYLL